MRVTAVALLAVAIAARPGSGGSGPPMQPRVEELRSVGGLPAHIAGSFDEVSACHVASDGSYLVFDRRAHAVFSVPRGAEAARKIVQIGAEPGRILRPGAFDSSPNGTFVVADAPGYQERVQFFLETGAAMGGFVLPGRAVPRITLGEIVLNGVGSVRYTGRTILMSQPEIGVLISEYGVNGDTLRMFGDLRPTGQERDRDVHIALNAGLVLTIPGGGYYFVFVSGVPAFRKYDASGRFVFERHIEGVELDPLIRALPTQWPRRRSEGDEFPVVGATLRTAAVDPDGNLWISLTSPSTYVYDSNGDKRRTLQFRAAGLVSPSTFFFTRSNQVLVTPGCYLFPRHR